MLTPQEISERTFIKAVFGGYDMAGVDEFFEVVVSDYAALYKENAVLKSKLKVLAKTVEEYRSVDDAMRRALLNAQKMGADQIDDAKRQSEEIVLQARAEAEGHLERVKRETAAETARLERAKDETSRYISAAVRILTDGISLLETLPAELPAPKQEKNPVSDLAKDIENSMALRFEEEASQAPSEDGYDGGGEEGSGGFEVFEENFSEDSQAEEGKEVPSKFDLNNLRFGDNYTKR